MKIFMACCLFLIAGLRPLVAQNAIITWSGLDMGYASAASPTTTLSSIAGQPMIGSGQSPTALVTSGFLAGLPFDTTGSSAGTGIILYSRSGTPGGTIWMRSGDGTIDTQVTTGEWPRLSHNGRYFIFHKGTGDPSRRDMNLYDMQTGRDTLLFSVAGDYLNTYDWYDDDLHIVFDYSCSVKMMRRDGTNVTNLFQVDCYDDAPVVRPGNWGIAFHNAFQGILITDSLGVNRHVVPNTGGGSYWPAWSPDGQWIAFGTIFTDSIGNYFKIHPDGTGLTALTSFTAAQPVRFGTGCVWTSDGSKLLVVGRVNGVQGIFAIATDGSRQMGLVPTVPGDPVDFVGTVTGNVNITLTDVPEHDEQRPTQVRLDQNYPNPFNPSTTIKYQLPVQTHVILTVYDLLGREVATLVNGVEDAGYKSVVWNASRVASGVYFYRLQSGTFTNVKKLLLLK